MTAPTATPLETKQLLNFSRGDCRYRRGIGQPTNNAPNVNPILANFKGIVRKHFLRSIICRYGAPTPRGIATQMSIYYSTPRVMMGKNTLLCSGNRFAQRIQQPRPMCSNNSTPVEASLDHQAAVSQRSNTQEAQVCSSRTPVQLSIFSAHASRSAYHAIASPTRTVVQSKGRGPQAANGFHSCESSAAALKASTSLNVRLSDPNRVRHCSARRRNACCSFSCDRGLPKRAKT